MKIALTEAARAAALTDLPAGAALRIAFAGGCGAMGFRLAATRRIDPDDLRLIVDEIPLALDTRAAAELDGSILDWSEDDGFVLDHPQWGVSCG